MSDICKSCGKPLIQGSNFCFNCGAAIKKGSVPAVHTKNVSNMSKNVRTLTFDILGQPFTVDEQSDFFIKLSVKIKSQRSAFSQGIRGMYLKEGSIDNVIDNFPDYISELMEATINSAVEIIKSHGIFDLNASTFYVKYVEPLGIESTLDNIIEEYCRILDYEKGINEYHDMVRTARSHAWRGGGAGIQGALSGYMKAQLLNTTNTVLHSIPDSNRRKQDLDEVKKAKSELFSRKSTVQAIVTKMEALYDGVFNGVFTELENAGKSRNVVRDARKAENIIENVIEEYNKGRLTEETATNYCRQAFFEDPTSMRTVETILRLEYGDISGVIKYAKVYGMYEPYQKKVNAEIAKAHKKELDRFNDMAVRSVTNTKDFVDIMNLALKLAESGVNVNDYLDKGIQSAISSRISFPCAEIDKKQISEYLQVVDERLNTAYFEKFKLDLENINTTNFDNRLTANIVKSICDYYEYRSIEHVMSGKNGFNFQRDKNDEYFKEYLAAAEIPESAENYLMYGRYSDSKKRADEVIAVTKSGLFASHAKDGYAKISKDWKSFSEAYLSYSDSSIIIDELWIDVSEKKFYELLVEIQNQLKDYFERYTDNGILKVEPDVALASNEVEFIKQKYDELDDIAALAAILRCGLKSQTGMSLLQDKKNQVLNKMRKYVNSIAAQPKKIAIHSAVYLVLSIVWLVNKDSLSGFWNFVCGFFVLGFIGDIFLKIKSFMEFRSEKKKYFERFNENLIVQNNTIKLK